MFDDYCNDYSGVSQSEQQVELERRRENSRSGREPLHHHHQEEHHTSIDCCINMNTNQCPPGCRLPDVQSLSPQRPETNDARDHRGRQASDEQTESSWWSPWEGVWNSFLGTEETAMQDQSEQNLQMKTRYNNNGRQIMDGILREEVHHHELMFPQVDESDGATVPQFQIRPRQRTHRSVDKDGFYSEKTSLSPIRNRSPKRSPLRLPRSPLRHGHSPVPSSPHKPSKSGLWYFLYGTEKRRMNFWTVLSILMLGPPIFLGGYFAGHGLESNPRVWVKDDNGGPASDKNRPTFPPYVYETNVFMIQDDILKEGDRLFLTSTNQGVHLKQESNGNLVLYNRDKTVLWHSGLIRPPLNSLSYSTILQADGNLVTHSTAYDAEQRVWTTQVEWSSGSESLYHGEYTLLLTPKADGLMIIRDMDSEIMWSTVPVELEASPTAYPTNSPSQVTRKPVDYPTPRPTLYPTQTPTVPPSAYPTIAPSPRPTQFPWPDTVRQSQVYKLQSGPIVGHTTHDSAKFWVLLGRAIPMQLVYWPLSESVASSRSMTLYPDAESNGAAIDTILGLQPQTMYLYEIRVNNEWITRGSFTTAPTPKQATSFKYLLTSCMNVKSNDGGYRIQPVWNEVIEKDVDFAMLAGDNVYLDYADWDSKGVMIYDRIWARFLEQRAESNFAQLIKSVPTYGSWDDHDFGRNNAEHRQPGKEISLKAWEHLWPNPYQGSSKGPGNYYSYSWGDVDFFVLDVRWYRNSFNGTLIGDPQLEWLEEKLVSSTAVFKILICASDIMEKGMTRDLYTIGTIVSRNRISGVLFNSGDIHRNEYKVQDIDTWPYRVHQLTSSGIARVWRRPFAIINVDTRLNDPEIKAEFYAAESSQRYTTWSNDPNLICSRYFEDEHNQARCTQRIRLSDLTP